eukprot:34138-Rhodomonas_salina.2
MESSLYCRMLTYSGTQATAKRVWVVLASGTLYVVELPPSGGTPRPLIPRCRSASVYGCSAAVYGCSAAVYAGCAPAFRGIAAITSSSAAITSSSAAISGGSAAVRDWNTAIC